MKHEIEWNRIIDKYTITSNIIYEQSDCLGILDERISLLEFNIHRDEMREQRIAEYFGLTEAVS